MIEIIVLKLFGCHHFSRNEELLLTQWHLFDRNKQNDRTFHLRQIFHHLQGLPATCDSMFPVKIDKELLPTTIGHQEPAMAMVRNSVTMKTNKEKTSFY